MSNNNNPKYFDLVATQWSLYTGAKPNVMVKCRVIDGPETGGEKIFYGNLHENAAQYTIEALRAFGWTGTDIETELDKEHGMGTLRVVGKEVDHEYPPGTVRRTMKYVNAYKPPSASPSGKPTGLGKRFKALAKSVVVPVDDAAKFDADSVKAAEVPEETPFG